MDINFVDKNYFFVTFDETTLIVFFENLLVIFWRVVFDIVEVFFFGIVDVVEFDLKSNSLLEWIEKFFLIVVGKKSECLLLNFDEVSRL